MRGDLRAAAVDDDRIDARQLEIDDVLGEGVGQRLVAHGVAAELDDDGLLVVADQVRQRLGQDARLDLRRQVDFVRGLSLMLFCRHFAQSLVDNAAIAGSAAAVL